jgi:hypothetical protein
MRDEQGRRKRRRDGGSAGPSQKKVPDSPDKRRKTSDSPHSITVNVPNIPVKFKVDLPLKSIPFVQTLTFTVGGTVEWCWPPGGNANRGTLTGKQTDKSVHARTDKSGSDKYLPKSRYSDGETDLLANAWWIPPDRDEAAKDEKDGA